MINQKSFAVVRNIKIPCTFENESELDAKAIKIAEKTFFSKQKGAFAGLPFVFKRSIDARDKNAVKLIYSVAAEIQPENADKLLPQLKKHKNTDAAVSKEPDFSCPEINNKDKRPVVVGFGPSGMFCALALAKAGLRPVVLERGDDVETRSKKVEKYWKDGTLDVNSNVQFGEGGAGTFSDGKLLTRISDSLCGFVLSEFVRFGAPKEITYLAKPHIGTDNLRKIVAAVRNEIISLGGEVRFRTKLEKINFSSSGNVCGVTDSDGNETPCGAVFLCIGHSARDTVKELLKGGFDVQPKPFSVGVRIEHLQKDIDNAMYGAFSGAPILSRAQYTLSRKFDGRAVYSFCMCPGGVVTASASDNGEIVTNGMSYYDRSGLNANSAIAVSVSPSDYGNTVQGAVDFQKNLETAAFCAAGNDSGAPIQLLGDFLSDKLCCEPSRIMPTYTGKTKLCKASDIFPGFVTDNLKKGIRAFEYDIKGFSCDDAVLTFPETRTSSPVRINRDERMVSVGKSGVYPCGEGAGYAGGITSAAVDGLKAAINYINTLKGENLK